MPIGILNIKITVIMADDISKKILIHVEADTDGVKQSVADLHITLDSPQQKEFL